MRRGEHADDPQLRGTSAEKASVVDHTAEGLRFGVDHIYEAGASQESLFEAEAAPLVAGCLEGVTGTLLAYGQTGAGKTYTVLGRGGTTATASYDERGLVPRTLQRLFDLAAKKRRAGCSVEIRVSCIEVYNEQLIDLLKAQQPADRAGELVVWEDPKDGGVHVKHLEVAPAASAEEALQLLYDAEINRAVGSHATGQDKGDSTHAMNVASSRSHLVVTAHVTCREASRRPAYDDDDAAPEKRFAKLHLVDLAGSERIKLTASRGATATVREASYINKSLTFLEQVVIALGDAGRDHVPYRSSKLTHVLKDSLGGACRTSSSRASGPTRPSSTRPRRRCASPRAWAASRCAPVANKRRADSKRSKHYGLLLGKLRAEVDALRSELAVRDLIRGRRRRLAYGPTTGGRGRRVRRAAKTFVDGGDMPPVVTLGQVHATYDALRALAVEAASGGRGGAAARGGATARVSAAREATTGGDGDDLGHDERLLVQRLKDVKREYRAAFDVLNQAKAEATHVDARRKYLFRILVARFQADTQGSGAAVDPSRAATSEAGALQVHPGHASAAST
ncbi:hypothetical protein JL720_975 [Aureococcus anophagefferens]|nr:hypothetical protein JL720_975 [Aureococcus anophagefferens]